VNEAAVALAYRHCEHITRSRARNFYYGIRLLPPAKRAAMCALYAMARRIDDVGDGPGPANPGPGEDRLATLEAVRASIALLAAAGPGNELAAAPPGDPLLIALADAAARYGLPLGAFDELVEGTGWDLSGRRYDTIEELVEYCRRVAGTIGRLSLAVYGTDDYEAAAPLADALGVALQLTNILRDLLEDRDVMGRVYLPREDRERFGVGPALEGREEDLMALICYETGRAARWYDEGLHLLPLLDRRSRACTAAMAGIYHRLLARIRAHPERVLSERVCLSAPQKLGVAAVSLAKGAA
jgi:15-cis-phytoene synthase